MRVRRSDVAYVSLRQNQKPRPSNRYDDTRCYFNVRSKADNSTERNQKKLKSGKKEELKVKTDMN